MCETDKDREYLIFSRMVLVTFFFFFFQAEDGIRDKLVTGVQTCALPISRTIRDQKLYGLCVVNESGDLVGILTIKDLIERSEERRVGKECRSRWSPYH